ncbi:MAG: alpha/beta fold hydrolase [Acidimicrobiales bacterium]
MRRLPGGAPGRWTSGVAASGASPGVEIAFEVMRPARGDGEQVILLIMGTGAQMVLWPEELCLRLAAGGFTIIRHDNRDCGASTHLASATPPDLAAAVTGDYGSASYRLRDMADDSLAVLDQVGVARAHVVGASMGGMIAQEMALRHPDRVASLCSIMSTTGDMSVGLLTARVLALFFSPPFFSPVAGAAGSGAAPPCPVPAVPCPVPEVPCPVPEVLGKEPALRWMLELARALSSPGYPFDEGSARLLAEISYERGFSPRGMARQLLAIGASGDRTEALRRLSLPALVVHGDSDPMIDVSGGEATAKALPGARLVVVPGMGHELPREMLPTLAADIAANTGTATR